MTYISNICAFSSLGQRSLFSLLAPVRSRYFWPFGANAESKDCEAASVFVTTVTINIIVCHLSVSKGGHTPQAMSLHTVTMSSAHCIVGSFGPITVDEDETSWYLVSFDVDLLCYHYIVVEGETSWSLLLMWVYCVITTLWLRMRLLGLFFWCGFTVLSLHCGCLLLSVAQFLQQLQQQLCALTMIRSHSINQSNNGVLAHNTSVSFLLCMRRAVEKITNMWMASEGCNLLVTLNVQHTVQVETGRNWCSQWHLINLHIHWYSFLAIYSFKKDLLHVCALYPSYPRSMDWVGKLTLKIFQGTIVKLSQKFVR